MSDRPPGPPRYGLSGTGFAGRPEAAPAGGLESALAEVRTGAPDYRRWWIREHAAVAGTEDSTPPWSERDEERARTVGAVDPWWMRSVADELERAHTGLRDMGAELTRIAGSAIGAGAAARCGSLAVSSHERASEAATLAAGARTASERAEGLLDDVTRRLAEVFTGETSAWHPGWHGAGPTGRGDGPDAHGGFSGYAAILRAVRAELGSAIDRLPILFEPHPGQPNDSADWAAASGWTPEPGTGPRLPGTDARRVETDTGVRIARLPDGPTG